MTETRWPAKSNVARRSERVLNLALHDLELGRECRQPFSSGSVMWLDILFSEMSGGSRPPVLPTRRDPGPESGWLAKGAVASGYRGANLLSWFSRDRRGFKTESRVPGDSTLGKMEWLVIPAHSE